MLPIVRVVQDPQSSNVHPVNGCVLMLVLQAWMRAFFDKAGMVNPSEQSTVLHGPEFDQLARGPTTVHIKFAYHDTV
jgi:hypothetical protein